MKIHFGKYAYHWHLIPSIKLHFERSRYNFKMMYVSFEFSWLRWRVEITVINTFSNDGW